MHRSSSTDAMTAELAPDPLDPAGVVSGAPETSAVVLDESGGVTTGVWEITAGVVRDVEVEERFVVLSGRATVELEDGTELELTPGVVGVLRAGERTVWHVHERLRKVFLIVDSDGAAA